jgi:hypothetical protein
MALVAVIFLVYNMGILKSFWAIQLIFPDHRADNETDAQNPAYSRNISCIAHNDFNIPILYTKKITATSAIIDNILLFVYTQVILNFNF